MRTLQSILHSTKLRCLALAISMASAGAVLHGQSGNPSVRFHTSLGDIDVILRLDTAPNTVVNFQNYLKKGAFTNSIFHRSVPGFIIQGGGYQLQNHAVTPTPQDPAVRNEFKISNTRGTLAMAKLGTDPNSATSQWFFNLADNSANLDNQNGGFTVFGIVANSDGLAVMDKIAALPVVNNGSPFDQLPVMNYKSGQVQEANYVLVTSIDQLVTVPPPSIDHIVSASGFGAFSAGAPGGYIEIYGSNLAGTTRGWATADFTGSTANHAPTSLDSVSVTINGRTAFVNYVSPTQVNVQVPDSFPKAGSYPVVLTYQAQISAPYSFTINPVEPGLLAPASFNVGGRQYVAAVHGANNALVANNIPGVPSAPAKPGETIVIYGTGWGGVTDTSAIAGEVNTRISNLDGSVQFTIGSTPAQVAYAGLAPGLVGVDQLNVVVPDSAPNGDLPLTATLNGSAIPQTLLLPVQK
jgi:uncharacterized protein (TIGR03437 family)